MSFKEQIYDQVCQLSGFSLAVILQAANPESNYMAGLPTWIIWTLKYVLAGVLGGLGGYIFKEAVKRLKPNLNKLIKSILEKLKIK